jgi:diacylglycerol kinase family enzyme
MLDLLTRAIRSRGGAVEVRPTMPHDGDAVFAETPEDAVVVAAGGDGTLHLAANALVRRGVRRTLAFFPMGTANVFARDAGLPRRIEALADLYLGGTPREYPLGWGSFTGPDGRAEERVFLMMAGAGWDAAVTLDVDPAAKRRFGVLAYATAVLRGLPAREPRFAVRTPGFEDRGVWLIASNGRHYAGPFLVAPDASPWRPELVMTLFARLGRADLAATIVGSWLGRFPEGRVTRRLATAVTLDAPGVPVQMDGDVVGTTPATFAKGRYSLPMILGPGVAAP